MTDQATRSDTIQLEVPLRPAFASSVRLVASSLAADAGFSVDEIEDLRLGVSEVFSVLAEHAGGSEGDPRLRALFSVDGDVLAIRLDSVPRLEAELDELATSILRSVVDSFEQDATGFALVKQAREIDR
jgi:hypothetical protein